MGGPTIGGLRLGTVPAEIGCRPELPNISLDDKSDDIHARCRKEFRALIHAIEAWRERSNGDELAALTELVKAAGDGALSAGAIRKEISSLPLAEDKSDGANRRRVRVAALCADLTHAMAELDALMARHTGRLRSRWQATLAITITLIVAALAAAAVLAISFPVSLLLVAAGAAGAAVLAGVPAGAYLARVNQSLAAQCGKALAQGRDVVREAEQRIARSPEQHEAFPMSHALGLLAKTKHGQIRLYELVAREWKAFKTRAEKGRVGAPFGRVQLQYANRTHYVPLDKPAAPNGPPRVISRFSNAAEAREIGKGAFNRVFSGPRNCVTRFQRDKGPPLPPLFDPKDVENLPSFLPSFQLEPGIQGARSGGTDLHEWLTAGKTLPLSAFREASADLKRLHDRGLYHRDIKLPNMTVRIIDGKHRLFFIDCDSMVQPSAVKGRLARAGSRPCMDASALKIEDEAYRASLPRGDQLAFLLVIIAAQTRFGPCSEEHVRSGGFYDPTYALEARKEWINSNVKKQCGDAVEAFLADPLAPHANHEHLHDMIDWDHAGADSGPSRSPP